MGYAPLLTANALQAMQQLELWLQERTLDEIDVLSDHPERLVRRGLLPGLVHDFVADRDATRHYVFLVLDIDDANRRLIINDIGHHAKSVEPS